MESRTTDECNIMLHSSVVWSYARLYDKKELLDFLSLAKETAFFDKLD